MPATSRWLVLLVMCTGYFLVLLDVTVVNVALPQLGDRLGTGVAGLQWVVDGYAVPLAALLLVGGSLGDVVGHKRVVLGGLVLFGLASLACGLAPTTGVLVAARVLQGVGAALLLPGTLAIIADTFPDRREQARAIGIWASVGSAALPAGPLLGGALVEGLGWRAVFLVNAPIVLVAAVLAVRVVRDRPPSGTTDRGPDWPGSATAVVALGALVLGIVELGHRSTGFGLVALAAAAVAVGGFLLVEHRSPHPMLPLDLLLRRQFVAANAVAGAMNLGTLGTLFLITLYLQTVQQRSPLGAGVALLPLFLPLTVLAPYAGRLASRRGPRLPMVLGLLVGAVGVALLLTASVRSAYPVLLPALLAWGVGLGLLTPAVVAAAIAAVGPERSGLASGANNTARQAGGALGIAIYGAVAGPPDSAGSFVAGMHAMATTTAVLWLAAAGVTLGCVGRGERDR
ncbi:MFS transporter [Nocardioides panacisoli]|uniref:MFS transporter n=1 Tax=Nocardioides panacisoli TaxID=627624 RepID=UPI0031DC774B